MKNRNTQGGIALLEALIGIVIFMLGALAMIALQANGIAAQTDSQSRIEVSNLVDQIVGEMGVQVDRTNAVALQADLIKYAYNTTTNGRCNFSGGNAQPTPPAALTKWIADITAKVPSSDANMQQILVDTVNNNQITVTVCWQSGSDGTARQHSVIAYVN